MTHQVSSVRQRWFRDSEPDQLLSIVAPDESLLPRQFGGLAAAAANHAWNDDALVFGEFRLLKRRRELLRAGRPVLIGNRAMDILIALIEARGELVTKDDLLSRVWPNTVVEENNLQFQISTLRKALGEDRDLIKTAAGRGYRFVGLLGAEYLEPPNRASAASTDWVGQSGARAERPPVGARPSLIVAPFENLSFGAEQDTLARCVTEDVREALGRLGSIAVMACGAVPFCHQSAELGPLADPLRVRFVVTGSVRRVDQSLRVHASLIDFTSGVHLWADHFDGAITEQFDFQDRIAEGVARLIEPHILEAISERPSNEGERRTKSLNYVASAGALASIHQNVKV